MDDTPPVHLTVYRWAGHWGPFRIRVPCGECRLTGDIIADVLENELAGIPVAVETREWLSEWWKPLFHRGWHAPIVMVDDRVISQGNAINRGLLTQAVVEAHVQRASLSGNHVFGKLTCPHCTRAKGYLEEAGIDFQWHDVIREPRSLYEMLGRVKPLIGPKTPVTVPQIWIDGQYVGGADELSRVVHAEVEPNPERGQCSLSRPGLRLGG